MIITEGKKIYVVSVDTHGVIETYEVEAKSVKDAKEKAKKLFMKEFWKKSLLHATIEESYMRFR